MPVELVEITSDNWRNVVAVEPHESQAAFVAPISRYLCLAHYDGVWNPLCVLDDGNVVGHLMWAFDGDEDAYWIGGVVIQHERQGIGLARAAVGLLIDRLRREQNATQFALSYASENKRASSLYQSMGFEETGEITEGEVVARLLTARW